MENVFTREQKRLNSEFFNFTDSNFYGTHHNTYGGLGAQGGAAPAPAASPSIPFRFAIANSTGGTVNATIGGASQNVAAVNQGNNGAITVTYQNGNLTYINWLQALMTYSFSVGMLYMQSTTTNQNLQQVTETQTDINGSNSTIYHNTALNEFQNQSGVSTLRCNINFNGLTALTVPILANATLNLWLYPQTGLDISQSLVGAPAKQGFANPQITGVPYKQLM